MLRTRPLTEQELQRYSLEDLERMAMRIDDEDGNTAEAVAEATEE